MECFSIFFLSLIHILTLFPRHYPYKVASPSILTLSLLHYLSSQEFASWYWTVSLPTSRLWQEKKSFQLKPISLLFMFLFSKKHALSLVSKEGVFLQLHTDLTAANMHSGLVIVCNICTCNFLSGDGIKSLLNWFRDQNLVMILGHGCFPVEFLERNILSIFT